ncbi:MAG: thiol-disulfide isomerase/thioredoxin, partial [Crocinitomicaceae bacterium]
MLDRENSITRFCDNSKRCMKNLIASLLIGFGITFSASAQLANGSIAPDFTLTDIDGNTHHLYDYLSEGKAVFVEFFACHCPTCWAYHNVGRLDSLNESYGPSGTNQVVVLMIEYDEWNGLDEFNGITGWTAGDWVTGNSVPMINAELGDRSIFTDYDMVYFTQIYKICPDKTTQLMNTAQTVA